MVFRRVYNDYDENYERKNVITAININPTTQSYIAEMFNDGVQPQIEDEPTWFIARDDEPNLIVNRHEYTTVWKDLVDKDIIALSNE